MATVSSLREHLIDELKDLLSAEQQLIEALPDMADAATQRQLKAAFKSHLAQTRGHEKRVSQALRQLKEKPDSKTCEAMEGLLEEGQELMSNGEPGALLDAMLITAAQKVEHYEIATYGTVRTYAQVLGERGVARLLDQTLREEKAADKKLTGIAEGSINKRAAREWHEQQTAAGMLQKGAEWVGATVGGALKRVRTQASDRSSSNGRKGRTTASRRRAARKSSGSRGRSRSRARTR
jgi:ferritin-like metal-binding protein YciE